MLIAFSLTFGFRHTLHWRTQAYVCMCLCVYVCVKLGPALHSSHMDIHMIHEPHVMCHACSRRPYLANLMKQALAHHDHCANSGGRRPYLVMIKLYPFWVGVGCTRHVLLHLHLKQNRGGGRAKETQQKATAQTKQIKRISHAHQNTHTNT